MVHLPRIRVGISHLHHPVLTLGPGRRAGIWFQGCSIHCAGCMSRDTWEPARPDDTVPLSDITTWIAALPTADVDGVTISGGEPFDQPGALHALARWLRQHFAGGTADVLVYSGYGYDELHDRHAGVLAEVDAVVTGPYRQADPRTPRRWRGSANQELVALSARGRRRYAEHVDAPSDSGLQVDVGANAVRLIGVPRPGDLVRIERGLAQRGIALGDRSWRR